MSSAPRGRPWLARAVLAIAVSALTACASSGSTGGRGLYQDVPSDLASIAPGTVIRSEPVTDLAAPLRDATATLILYRSQGALGGAVAVSGVVLVPLGDPPAGGWPIVAWGHGTSGVGDACTPSKYPNLYDGSSWLGYATMVSDLLEAGYLVVAPDYEGLGTRGMHTYLDAAAEGSAMVDGVLAARALEPDASTRWAAVGHSQGGQAAIAAGEEVDAVAGLTYVGAVALAPAQHELDGVEAMASDPSIAPYLGYMAAGMRAIDPGFDYARFLGPTFLDLMREAERDCFSTWFGADTANVVLEPGKQLNPDWSEDPTVRRYFADTVVGRERGAGPVLVLQGTEDGLYWTYPEFLQELCASGTPAQGRVYTGVDHTGVLEAGWPDARRWLADRFAGSAVRSDCPG